MDVSDLKCSVSGQLHQQKRLLRVEQFSERFSERFSDSEVVKTSQARLHMQGSGCGFQMGMDLCFFTGPPAHTVLFLRVLRYASLKDVRATSKNYLDRTEEDEVRRLFLGTSASLLVTSALLLVTRSYY